MNMPDLLNNCRVILVLSACISVLAGCTEALEESKVEPTYSSLWDNLFDGCGINCHSPSAGDGTETGPDLSSKSAFYSNLVGKTVISDFPAWTAFKTGDCNSTSFVAPGKVNASTVAGSLILSVSDTLGANQNCTTSYNLHEVNKVTIADPDLISALTEWIASGAAND